MYTVVERGLKTEADFLACETHDIQLSAGSRIVLDSEGRGWKNVYAALSSQRRWTGRLQPIDHLCFAYCLRRTARIERMIEGEDRPTVFVLRPRQFGFIPTRVATGFRLTGSADMVMLYLRGDMVEQTAWRLFGLSASSFEISRQIGVVDPLLEQLALEIADALHRPTSPHDAAYMDEVATMAASHILRHHAQRRDGCLEQPEEQPGQRQVPETTYASLRAGLYRLRDYIDEHIDCDLALETLTREAGMSPNVFKRAFVETYGDTPHQYIIKRRIEKTKQLLIGTDLPICEVALLTGFASQSHLSDLFKRVTGETPRSFRNQSVSQPRAMR